MTTFRENEERREKNTLKRNTMLLICMLVLLTIVSDSDIKSLFQSLVYVGIFVNVALVVMYDKIPEQFNFTKPIDEEE